MSEVYFMDGEIVEAARSQVYAKQPKFRRASRGMMLGYAALDSLFRRQSWLYKFVNERRLGLVIGTSQGEFETTKEFLTTLVEKDIARPILFQNSLHNAILGFLSIEFGLKGASMTVSNQMFSGEDAVSTSIDFLRSGWCDACIAIGLDIKVEALSPVWKNLDPPTVNRGEGAGAVLLVNQSGLSDISGQTPLSRLSSVNVSEDQSPATLIFDQYYDSNGISVFIEKFRNNPQSQKVIIEKPSGCSSYFQLEAE